MKKTIKIKSIYLLLTLMLFMISVYSTNAQCGASMNHSNNLNEANSSNSMNNNHKMCDMKGHKSHSPEVQDHSAHLGNSESLTTMNDIIINLNHVMTDFHSLPNEQMSAMSGAKKENYDKLMVQLHDLIDKMESFNEELESKNRIKK